VLDLAVFVAVPDELQRARFAAFYHWKRLDPGTIDALWRERTENEWPAVDAQRDHADLVFAAAADGSRSS
jgi:hypothetical protein